MSKELRQQARALRIKLGLPKGEESFIWWRIVLKGPVSQDYFSMLLGCDKDEMTQVIEKLQRKHPEVIVVGFTPSQKLPVLGLERHRGTVEKENEYSNRMRTLTGDYHRAQAQKEVKERLDKAQRKYELFLAKAHREYELFLAKAKEETHK